MTNTLPEIYCEKHPEWIELYTKACSLALSNIETPAFFKWKPQMNCMPGVDCSWVWDSCFMPFYTCYSNGQMPGMSNLDNFYAVQREDGFIGMTYRPSNGELAYGERINPPLFAWAELRHWKATGDNVRLKTVLPRLIGLFDWIKANRRRENGLYWFEDTGSTGMDNSPRSGYFSEHLNGSDICHIDLCAQQALSAECIHEIAAHLGEVTVAERFLTEYKELCQKLNQYHWEPRTGFYYDTFNRSDLNAPMNFLNHKTIAGFWPMAAGIASKEQTASLVEHLKNPKEFWTPHPVASLSRDDINYQPDGAYWRGGVWAPANYMIIQGLRRYGYHSLARELALKHLEYLYKVYRDKRFGSIFEAYAPEYAEPAKLDTGAWVRTDFVGWSGLGPIAMLIENIFGLQFDAVTRRVEWTIYLDEEHGIKNLEFANGTISLSCTKTDRFVIRTESTVSFELILNLPEQKEHVLQKVNSGKQEFAL